MPEPSAAAKKRFDELGGKYVPAKAGSQFDGLPVLGPYATRNDGTYTGQWKDGKRHGFGTRVRIFDF